MLLRGKYLAFVPTYRSGGISQICSFHLKRHKAMPLLVTKNYTSTRIHLLGLSCSFSREYGWLADI